MSNVRNQMMSWTSGNHYQHAAVGTQGTDKLFNPPRRYEQLEVERLVAKNNYSSSRFFNRRNSDQLSPTSGLKSGDNKDHFSVKDDEVINMMSLSSGGSINGDLSQSNLHRSQPFQDITTLGVTESLYPRKMNQGLETGSGKSQPVYNDYNMNSNRLNISSKPPGVDLKIDTSNRSPDCFTSLDRKTTLNIDNTRLRQALDDQNKSTRRDSSNASYEMSSDNSASQSGRRSAIPVPVRRRSVSACGEPNYDESCSLRQSAIRMGHTTPVMDGVGISSYKPVQTSKPVPSMSHSQHNYADQFVPISSPVVQVGSVQKKSVGQKTFQSRPQSANAIVGYTHRSSLPSAGRVLPVTPSNTTSTPMRNSRTLPVTPAGSSVMPARTSGRSLPVVPDSSVQNQRRSSGRALPTTPSNTSGRLPMSAAADRHRSQLPKKSSQSQPGSRSTSPTSLQGYITYTQPPVESTTACPAASGISRPRSCIPRSRGQSRDTSPARRGDGPQMLNVLQLQKGKEIEAAVNTALLQHNLVSRLQMDSSRREDAMSETSSMSSDSCGRNAQGTIMDASVIIELVSSGVWSERRDGLVSLQTFLKSDGQLSGTELKKLTEMFTRMFYDPNPKVFVVFLETLPSFVSSHAADVPSDWMYTCLSRLLEKTSADLLKSVSERLQAALKSVRDTFAVEDQWASLSRFVCESTKISDPKVRLSIVEYLNDMVVSMDSSELLNSTNVQQVTLRVISWMMDRKFQTISRVAQHIIIALFNVNTPEFSTVLSSLPRSMQDAAFKLLQNHMSSVSYDMAGDSNDRTTAASLVDDRSFLGSRRSNDKYEDSFSTEDLYASFKKTAEDIQNLSLQD